MAALAPSNAGAARSPAADQFAGGEGLGIFSSAGPPAARGARPPRCAAGRGPAISTMLVIDGEQPFRVNPASCNAAAPLVASTVAPLGGRGAVARRGSPTWVILLMAGVAALCLAVAGRRRLGSA